MWLIVSSRYGWIFLFCIVAFIWVVLKVNDIIDDLADPNDDGPMTAKEIEELRKLYEKESG